MANQETEIGGVDRGFPSTSWTILKTLRNREATDYTDAMQRLVGQYWKPVYCLIRHVWNKKNEEAKDLTQEFFLSTVLEGSLVDQFAPDRGSFRTYLKSSLNNFMRDAARTAGRKKRGGDARILSLNMTDVELTDIVPDAQAMTPDQVFDAAWKNLVLARAVEILERNLQSQGKQAYFEVFSRYDLDPNSSQLSYRTVGEALGLSPDTVKNYLTRAREEFRKAVLQVVSDYVDNQKDLSSEMNELFGP
jgi:RNA polymerase sigma-70 factor (ECF subfamily)